MSLITRRAPFHRGYGVSVYALALIAGVRAACPGTVLGALLLSLGLNALLTDWAVRDSIARGRPIPLLSRDWLFLTSGVSLPAYVIWSRGLRGCVWLILQMLLWGLLYVVAFLATVVALTLILRNRD